MAIVALGQVSKTQVRRGFCGWLWSCLARGDCAFSRGVSCRCLQSAPTPYSYLQWPQTDGVDDTDQNPQPSDPLQALYLDANGDGQISQSEFENVIGSGADQSKVDELFAKIDSNGDGSIDKDELGAFMKANRPSPAHGGGLMGKIESLLDQYRSTATEESSDTAGATLATAA
jgi:EF-hand domain pair